MNFVKQYKGVFTSLILIAITCFGFAIHFSLFSQTEYVNGTDGGFYAYKVREIVEEGRYNFSLTQAPSSPPVLFLTSAAFAKFFGVFNGVKIATSLYSVLLGVSIFILTKYITKSNKAGLVAAFFAVFSPLSLRIAADIRKNACFLFFLPLMVYFILKFFDNWKYAIPLGVVALLGLLSHNSVITIWFFVLGYLAFYLGVKWKLKSKEFLPVFLVNLVILFLMIFFYGKISSSLEIIAADRGSVQRPAFENLNSYILPLMIVAVPGILIAIKKSDNKNLFMMAWLILNFFLTFSQVISAKQYWRFLLPMFVPVCTFVGYSANWLLNKILPIGIIVLVATGIIATSQLFEFGRSDMQMQPQLSGEILTSFKDASEKIDKNEYIYTSYQYHSYFWVRYYFGFNTRKLSQDSISDINTLLNEGNQVYFFEGREMQGGDMMEQDMKFDDREMKEQDDFKRDNFIKEEGDFGKEGALFSDENLETVYQEENVKLVKFTSDIEEESLDIGFLDMPEEELKRENQEYSYTRFRYLSTFLILPYEIINMIDPSYLPLWQIQLGFPLSLLLAGLIVSIPLRLKPKFNDAARFLLIASGIFIVIIIYGFGASFFWGEGGQSKFIILPEEGEEFMDDDDEGRFCGDGICDEAEQADPGLCPKDCE